MKSPITLNLILSAILAVIAYFAFPADLLPSNTSLAAGILLGGFFVPLLIQLFNKQPTSASSSNTTSTTLYVGNLPYRANEQSVREHFSAHGKVHSVRLMKDRRTGKRKGYGFVEMDSQDIDAVIKNLNDTEFQERTLKVRLAKDKSE